MDAIPDHTLRGSGQTVHAFAFELLAAKRDEPVNLQVTGPNGGGIARVALTARNARALARQLVRAAKIIEAAERAKEEARRA